MRTIDCLLDILQDGKPWSTAAAAARLGRDQNATAATMRKMFTEGRLVRRPAPKKRGATLRYEYTLPELNDGSYFRVAEEPAPKPPDEPFPGKRILALMADGRPRTARETAEALGQNHYDMASWLGRLRRAGQLQAKRTSASSMTYSLPVRPTRQIIPELPDTGPEIPWRGEWHGTWRQPSVLDLFEVRG